MKRFIFFYLGILSIRAMELPSPSQCKMSEKALKYSYLFGVSSKKDDAEYKSESVQTAVCDSSVGSNSVFFAIYDGHNGKSIAQDAEKKLVDNLKEELCSRIKPNVPTADNTWVGVRMALWFAYVRTESQLEDIAPESGACTISAYLHENWCHLSWLGNLRALILRNGLPIDASEDHTISIKEQMLKSVSKSSRSLLKETEGCNDTKEIVSYTRSFGDQMVKRNQKNKEQKDDCLNAVPGYKMKKLCDNDLILLASASLWNAFADTNIKNEKKRLNKCHEIIAYKISDLLKKTSSKRSVAFQLTQSIVVEQTKVRKAKLQMVADSLREEVEAINKAKLSKCSPTVLIIEYTERE